MLLHLTLDIELKIFTHCTCRNNMSRCKIYFFILHFVESIDLHFDLNSQCECYSEYNYFLSLNIIYSEPTQNTQTNRHN